MHASKSLKSSRLLTATRLYHQGSIGARNLIVISCLVADKNDSFSPLLRRLRLHQPPTEMAAPPSASTIVFSSILFIVLCSLLIISPSTQLQSNGEEGSISVLVSDKGLEFAKDLLISKALNSMLPLQLPHIRKSVKVPVVGVVDVLLSNVTIASIGIASSFVRTGEEGIALIVSGATANLSLNWEYSYRPWFIPVSISKGGTASVKVYYSLSELSHWFWSLETSSCWR